MSVEAVERWRKPAVVHEIDYDRISTFTDGWGREFARPHMICDFETVERIRLGYLCINCLEPFERPMPERCSVCGFDVKDDQPKWFNEEFKGETVIGPTRSLEEIQELDLGTKGLPSNLWLPPGAGG